MKNMSEIRDYIISGLKYIGFLDIDEDRNIDVNLIVEVREYLEAQSNEWYEKLFNEAYDYDKDESKPKKYSYDEIIYNVNNMHLVSCELYAKEETYKNKRNQNFQPPILLSNLDEVDKYENKYGFKYINEIDHFFTHYINNYLIGKGCRISEDKDPGLFLIKNKIEEFKNTNS
ncbi:MAG: hypothetical protein IJP71_04595 [Lachnospiraceae bacterium]|nr:hypothetical protein [Lachnospiraceae bacterium]